ncbi:MAG: hypothetical protein ACHQQ3_13990, partial [Gemmatimonadales bacterium]
MLSVVRHLAPAPLVASLVTLLAVAPASAQVMTLGTSDYARAEALLNWNARDLVVDEAVVPRWTAAASFWYRNHSAKGYEFLVVDAATGAKRPLFDNVRLAAELSQRADTSYDPTKLPFQTITLSTDAHSIQFDVGKKRLWLCDIVAYKCAGPDSIPLRKAS